MFFTEKNVFYREKYEWQCKKYISHFRNIFLHKNKICVTNMLQIKYKSLWNI